MGRVDLRHNPNPDSPTEPGALPSWDEPNTTYAIDTPPFPDNGFHSFDVMDPPQPMLFGYSPDERAMHAWSTHTGEERP